MDPNTFVGIIFTAYPLCSWHCSACLNRTYIGSGLADTEAPITKLIAKLWLKYDKCYQGIVQGIGP